MCEIFGHIAVVIHQQCIFTSNLLNDFSLFCTLYPAGAPGSGGGGGIAAKLGMGTNVKKAEASDKTFQVGGMLFLSLACLMKVMPLRSR